MKGKCIVCGHKIEVNQRFEDGNGKLIAQGLTNEAHLTTQLSHFDSHLEFLEKSIQDVIAALGNLKAIAVCLEEHKNEQE